MEDIIIDAVKLLKTGSLKEAMAEPTSMEPTTRQHISKERPTEQHPFLSENVNEDRDTIPLVETTIATALTDATKTGTELEIRGQPDIIPMEAHIPFNNTNLCYFKARLGAPTRRELEPLIRKSRERGTLLHGREILEAITKEVHHDHRGEEQDHLQPREDRPKSIKLRDIPRSTKEYERLGPFELETKAFADSGSSCSVISKELAMALRLVPIQTSDSLIVLDINQGRNVHNLVTYVQLDFPGTSYRQIVLCLIMDKPVHPFLLGSNDQAQLNIRPDLSTRSINLGEQQHPAAAIPFMTEQERHATAELLQQTIPMDNGGKRTTSTLQASEVKELRERMPSLACLFQTEDIHAHMGTCHGLRRQDCYSKLSYPGLTCAMCKIDEPLPKPRTSMDDSWKTCPQKEYCMGILCAACNYVDKNEINENSHHSLAEKVFIAYCASLKTEEPLYADHTFDQLPPDPRKSTMVCSCTGTRDMETQPSQEETKSRDSETANDEPALTTGLPEGATPPEPPRKLFDDIFDWLYTHYLKTIQKIEMASEQAVEEKEKELKEDIELIWSVHCTKEMEEHRPADFPKELWKFVMDLQKPMVKERFAKFPDETRTALIKDIMEKLDIYDIKDAKEFFRAQALANIDVMGHTDPTNPPTIPGYDFTIDVNTKDPVYLKPQRFNQTETAFLEARIAELMTYGKIRPSQSMYNTHLCLVPYHDRITKSIAKWGANAVAEMFKPENRPEVATWYRLTNNFKPINEITKAFHFPMPSADDIYHYTRGARYWSLTDIKDAFFVVKMDEKSSQYTAFTTPGGRYEFTVMPQGAQNSPMFWSSIAADTFSHIPKDRLINFIDDTTCHSRRFLHHMESQQLMYDAMRGKKMVSKLSKCHYLYPSAKILGHIMSEFGRTPSPESIQPILDMAPPRSIGDLRSFLGLINFNIDYLPMAKNFLGPLQELLKKDADVARDWNENHDQAFQQAKLALTSAPCLLTVDITKPFVVHVDACRIGRGIGAVLLQQNERGDWRPVAYYSYRLKEGERTRCATELEAMALVYAIKHWSAYLRVQEFTAIVDHHALIYLVTQPAKTSNVRLLNWISDLHAYRFKIYHRSGKKHMDADGVSRLLQYKDLEVHNAMDTSDEEAARLNGPATVKDIIDLHRIIGAYQDQIEELRAQLEEANPDLLKSKHQEAMEALDTRAQDLKERQELFGKMASEKQRDYWSLVTSKDWQESLRRPPEDQEEEKEVILPATPEQQAAINLTPEEEWMRYQKPDEIIREEEPPKDINRPRTRQRAKAEESMGKARVMEEESMEKARAQTAGYNTRRRAQATGAANEVEEEQEEGPRAPRLPRALLRRNYPPVGPTRNQYIANHTRPLDVPTIDQRQDDFDLHHPELNDFSDLTWKVFQDPVTKRIYRVMFVYYEHRYNVVAAYRKVLDDMPPDPFDAYPWEVQGPKGIKELVDNYQDNIMDSPEGPLIPWPKSEYELLCLQEADPNLQPIIARMRAKTNEQGIIKDEDRVYKYTETKTMYLPTLTDGSYGALRIHDPRKEQSPYKDRVAMPLTLVPTLLQLYHDQMAHPGFNRSMDTIKLKYWWPTMRHDVLTYTQSCQFCRWSKANKAAAEVPVQAYEAAPCPWWDVHMDLCGPFRTTERRNVYIAVFKCSLTRAITLCAIPAKTPLEVAKALIDKVYLKHGAPKIIHSDQGTEFINTVIEQVNAIFQVKHVPTTPGNPRSNGLVENHMGILKDQLTAYTNAIQDDWDTYLSTVEFAYMTTVNSQTGFTPFFLLYGREANQPHETWIGAFENVTSLSHYVKRLIRALQESWEYVAEQKPKEVKKMNKVPSQRRQFHEYEVGDRFYLAERPATNLQHYSDEKRTKIALKPKMQIRFVGPFTITKKFSPVLYEASVNGELKAVHALAMKPDPVSKYYTMHRNKEIPMEERKVPIFKPKILPSGKPQIPHRVHKRLRSLNSKLNRKPQAEPEAEEEDEAMDEVAQNEDDENEEYEDEEEDDEVFLYCFSIVEDE
jgi:RNase H-like domain found in reverse transcriptase/Reverse transcriptase (RNA-dependent DNA polymerase)/Integrase zinc binding domain/Integrase core domain